MTNAERIKKITQCPRQLCLCKGGIFAPIQNAGFKNAVIHTKRI